MDHLVIASYFPLYFLAAWAMSDRNVAAGLKYRIPFSIRRASGSIRYFWLVDLGFAALAFPFVYFAAQQINLHAQLPFGTKSYAAIFVLMGLLWPEMSGFRLITKGGRELSIAKLRDRFAGPARFETTNDHLTYAMNAWVDRVVDAVRARPEVFETYLRSRLQLHWLDYRHASESDLDALRGGLLKQAEKDFQSL